MATWRPQAFQSLCGEQRSGDPRVKPVERVVSCRWLGQPYELCLVGTIPRPPSYPYQWWQGPEWLTQPESHWPLAEHTLILDSTEELVVNPSRVMLHTNIQDHALPLLQHMSSYSCLIQVTAWILRYIHNSCQHLPQQQGALSTKVRKEAEIRCLS